MPCPRFLMPRRLLRLFLLYSCDSLECRGGMPQRLPVASPYDKMRTTVADRRTDAEPSSLVPNIRMRMPAAAPVIQPRISHPISRISSVVAAILAVFLKTAKESARPTVPLTGTAATSETDRGREAKSRAWGEAGGTPSSITLLLSDQNPRFRGQNRRKMSANRTTVREFIPPLRAFIGS